MGAAEDRPARYGMAIDLDRCTGCGACAVACAVENNVPPVGPTGSDRTGLTWMRITRVTDGTQSPGRRAVFIPVSCQHCGRHTPCVSVCPQNAVDVDPQTGVVSQIPERCLGCRYCMAACPYHARYFNWWDPSWPGEIERTLNPDVSVRMRGVVEKCNFCHGRWHAARAKAAAAGRRSVDPADYVPACVEACPERAIVFGDLNDPRSEVSGLAADRRAFRLLAGLGTEPKVFYLSEAEWVHRLAESPLQGGRAEPHHA